jgi:outer membrane receptor for ferrienterochelin and colicin
MIYFNITYPQHQLNHTADVQTVELQQRRNRSKKLKENQRNFDVARYHKNHVAAAWYDRQDFGRFQGV